MDTAHYRTAFLLLISLTLTVCKNKVIILLTQEKK